VTSRRTVPVPLPMTFPELIIELFQERCMDLAGEIDSGCRSARPFQTDGRGTDIMEGENGEWGGGAWVWAWVSSLSLRATKCPEGPVRAVSEKRGPQGSCHLLIPIYSGVRRPEEFRVEQAY